VTQELREPQRASKPSNLFLSCHASGRRELRPKGRRFTPAGFFFSLSKEAATLVDVSAVNVGGMTELDFDPPA